MAHPYKVHSVIQTSADGLDGVESKIDGLCRFVGKSNARNPYCLANEHVSAKLAFVLGLQVPPFFFASDSVKEEYFASVKFASGMDTPPPVDPDECIRRCLFHSVGVTMFDVLIANPDRHAKNLCLDKSENPWVLRVFDHGHAVFGPGEAPAYIWMMSCAGQLWRDDKHCLAKRFANCDHFQDWADRIRAIPDFVFSDACDEVKHVLPDPILADQARDFLLVRKQTISTLVNSNSERFEGIGQWTMLL